MAILFNVLLQVRLLNLKSVGCSGPADANDLPGGLLYVQFHDDLSNFVWLEPTEACTGDMTAKYLLLRRKTLGVRCVLASDTATYFKSQVIA